MTIAIEEIDHQSDGHPAKEPFPRLRPDLYEQIGAKKDAQHRYQGILPYKSKDGQDAGKECIHQEKCFLQPHAAKMLQCVLQPLVKETGGPKLTYRIAMGVRHSDQHWKRDLNKLISQNRAEILAILRDYGVPLLDENDKPPSP